MNTRSETMTPEFAARELLHSLHIQSVATPMEKICDRLGVLVERTGEIDAEAFLLADGAGEVIILLGCFATQRFCRDGSGGSAGVYCLGARKN